MYTSKKWVLTRVLLGLVMVLMWGSPLAWAVRIDMEVDNLDATSITLGGREISSWDEIEGSGGTLNEDNVAITGGTIANTDIDNADISNSRITSSSMANGTIDNTPIGLTTPSAGVFTTLATDNVSNIEFSYLEGLSSNLQLQLNGLRPLTDLDFTGMGVATFDNDVIAAAFLSTCDPSLNQCVLNISNAGKRTGTHAGDISVDNTTNTPYIRSNNNTAEIPFVLDNNSITFTNKTYDPAGTGNVFTHYTQEDFTILKPVAADNSMLFKAQYAMTVSAIHCIAEGGGTITLQILECSSTGTSCAGLDGSTTITCDSDGATDDGSLSNPSIDAGDWVKVLYGAPSGTVNTLTYSIYYSESQ